jgi:hypothetical protein
LLWGIGLGVSSWILLSQHSQVVADLDLGAHSGIHFPSAPSVTTRRAYQEEHDDETPRQHAQRQKAARENQAWLVRKFHMGGNKLPGIEGDTQYRASVIQEQQSEGRRPYLPSWLMGGANNRARGGGNGKLDQEEQQPQYIDPQCEHFNHTIMRPTHGCQVNTDTFLVYCNFENLRIDVTKITSDRGGELLESVMGRDEGPEFPVYEKGAFSSNRRPKFEVPNEYRGNLHYMENVLNNMKYPTTTKKKKKNKPMMDMSCVETWSGTTLFLTRYEYVNLYHTMTDWWNAYFVMPPNDRTNVRVVFLDAHAQGNLDPAWEQIFGKFTYVQHLPDEGGVCFEKAVFVPPGYISPLFPDMATLRLHCPLRRLAEEFSEHVLQSFGLQKVRRIPGKIVVIDRKPYVSHPRSKPASMGRVLLNLEELKRRLLKVKHVTSVELVHLETMSFREQLATIGEAHILIGNHGAGLSHVLFMDQRSHLLEFSEDYKEFFIYLSEWKGVQHTPIPLVESSRLSQSELARTISTVESILGE